MVRTSTLVCNRVFSLVYTVIILQGNAGESMTQEVVMSISLAWQGVLTMVHLLSLHHLL